MLSISHADEWTLKSLKKHSPISTTNVHTRRKQFVSRGLNGAGYNLMFDTQIVPTDCQRPSNIVDQKRIYQKMCSDNHSTVPISERTMWAGRDMQKLLYVAPINLVHAFDLPTYAYPKSDLLLPIAVLSRVSHPPPPQITHFFLAITTIIRGFPQPISNIFPFNARNIY